MTTISLPPALAAARPIHAVIDSGALRHNLARLRQRLNRSLRRPRIWATAKADAYGHGLVRLLPALRAADGLAVYGLDEARLALEHGWHTRILVMGGLPNPQAAQELPQAPLDLVIDSLPQLHWLITARQSRRHTVWLRYCSDMNHGGFDDQAYLTAYRWARDAVRGGKLAGVGHLGHYASAEHPVRRHLCDKRFDSLIESLPGEVSRSNSAAVLQYPDDDLREDWTRIGLALYGASPLPDRSAADLGLLPVMSLHSTVTAVRHLAAGAPLGYGGDFVAPHPMRIGVVAAGYADGYPRGALTGTPVRVDGAPSRVLGRVGMDSLAVDLTSVPAGLGTPVTLWGSRDLPVETVARAAGTIAAQLFTAVNFRRVAVELR